MGMTLDQLLQVKDRTVIRAELLRQLQGVYYTTKSGFSPGSVGADGIPNNDYQFRVKIMAAGSLGTATFQVSTDGGNTYSATTPVPGSGLFPVSGTGLTLVFANGPTGVGDSFELADVFSFDTNINVLPATAWQAFSVPLSLVENDAQALEELFLTLNLLAQGGFLSLAQRDWVDLLVENFYDLARIKGQPTKGLITLSDVAGSGPHAIAENQLWLLSNSGLRYNSVGTYVLPLSGTVQITVQAERAGSQYNVANGTITQFVTALGAGVTANNPDPGGGTWITQQGTNDESDDGLKKRALARWPELGTGATSAVYDKWAREASGGVTRTTSRVSTTVAGQVELFLAGPAGPVAPPVVAAVQAYVDPLVPLCVTALVQSAAAVAVTVTADVYVAAGNMAQAQIDCARNLDALFVGGVNSIGETLPGIAIGGTVYLDQIREQLMVPAGVRNTPISLPVADLALTPTQVATLTQNLTFIPI